jgi:hypothetical protein
MAKIQKSIASSMRAALENQKVKLAGLAAIGTSLLVTGAAAAPEDFSFINDTLQGVGSAVLGVIPLFGSIVTAGGPVVIKTAVYMAICAPFIILAMWGWKKL